MSAHLVFLHVLMLIDVRELRIDSGQVVVDGVKIGPWGVVRAPDEIVRLVFDRIWGALSALRPEVTRDELVRPQRPDFGVGEREPFLRRMVNAMLRWLWRL